MVQDTIYELFKPSDRFFKRFLLGSVCGRKLELWDYYRNYFFRFKDIATNIFEYDGLSKELTKEIEERLFYFGRCGIIKDGELFAVDVAPYGLNRYGKPTGFNFTFKNGDTVGNNDCTIDKNGVYALNTYDNFPTALIAEQYAFQLAHVDTSIVVELINSRMMDVLKAPNNASAESARQYQNDIYKGRLSFITDRTEDIEIDRTTKGIGHLKEYIDTKDRFLKDVYETFGVKRLAEKRERMITGEVESTTDLMMLNLKEMLDCRKKMCKDINKIFGTNASVFSHIDLDNDGNVEKEKEFEKGVKENV